MAIQWDFFGLKHGLKWPEAHSLKKVEFDFHFKCHLRKTDKEKWEGEMIRRNTFIRKRMPNEKILYLLIWRSFSHYKNKIWNKNWDENRKLKRRELLHSLEVVANEIRNENRTELSLLNALQVIQPKGLMLKSAYRNQAWFAPIAVLRSKADAASIQVRRCLIQSQTCSPLWAAIK